MIYGTRWTFFDCFSELAGNIGKEKARDHHFSPNEGEYSKRSFSSQSEL
jgi:hypothetical protein